jgi:hypothetical protein
MIILIFERRSEMNNFVGIHAFLAWCPIWLTALVLYAITDCVIHILRDWREGFGYQVAYSAKIGDTGLVGCVLIAATILKRGDLVLPTWLMSPSIQPLILFACLVLGVVVCVKTLGSRSGQAGDIYHDVFIVPLILFFAITLLPVIYLGGTTFEQIAAVCLILLWATLVVFDFKACRMNQRAWLKGHGIRMR